MTSSPIRFRTLTQRFGALYAIVIAILVGVSAIVTVYLQSILVDAERLFEEAREQTGIASLITEIDVLEGLLDENQVDAEELRRAQRLLAESVQDLTTIDGDEHDPSRDEHQDAEDRIAERVEESLLRANAVLAESPNQAQEAKALLATARHYARVLFAEAKSEANETAEDLRERASTARAILVSTWAIAVVLLALGLVLVHRGIVMPLRTLRQGAERFGNGELSHRIRVRNDDEIRDLADSFNAMADRLARAQDDLEERVRQRTREFIRAARLADLGVLASGIAHEINTPLASIASSAEGLERRCSNGAVDTDALREYSRVIAQEAFRAREITTRMLALVRQEPSEISRVSLRLIVEQATAALQHAAERRRVTLAAPRVADEITLNANAGELVQILVNLLSNAIDASRPGGRVVFDARVVDGSLCIEVTDEGTGIREEDVERVFEPFFTTKRAGEGTGLGLALVATMVEYRSGRISVESELGEGSTFRVSVPIDWQREA